MNIEKFAKEMSKKYGKDYWEEDKEPIKEEFRSGDLIKDLVTGLKGIYLGQHPENSEWSMVHIIGEEFSERNYKTLSTKNLELISRKEDRKSLKELEKEIKEETLNKLKKHYGRSI